MKKLLVLSVLWVAFSQINSVKAGDDVYDKPTEKKVKIKQTYTEPVEQPKKIISEEKTQPYTENGNSSVRVQSNEYNRNDDNYSDNNDFGSDFGYGYSDRIRRFHNPSIQFNYGYNSYNNFYDPYNSYSYNNNNWNSWDNYAFTPSWTYGYNNFYNPFCGNTQIIIIQPGFSSWYNTGFYNPYNSWNNYYNSYGFSPYCSNTIYNYGYSNYEGYYDNHRKNVVYTPRTGGYSNTNNFTKGNNTNYNYNQSTNTNNTGGFTNGNNTPQNYNTKKWGNENNNSNPENNNVYKYNNKPENNWNNNSTPAPSNNNNNNGWGKNDNNSNTGNSGIKIGSRPK